MNEFSESLRKVFEIRVQLAHFELAEPWRLEPDIHDAALSDDSER